MLNSRKSRLVVPLALSAGIVSVLAVGDAGLGRCRAGLGRAGAETCRRIPSVTLDNYGKYGVSLDLGVYAVAGTSPFEVRVTRKSYAARPRAVQVKQFDGVPWYRPLPAAVATFLAGCRIPACNAYQREGQDGGRARQRRSARAITTPAAPDPTRRTLRHTRKVAPLTRLRFGAVWGVQAGWSANTFNYFSDFGQSTVDTAERQIHRQG